MEIVSNCQLKYINGQFYINFSFCQCFPSAPEYFSLSLCREESVFFSSLFARVGNSHFRRRVLHLHLVLRIVFYRFCHFSFTLLKKGNHNFVPLYNGFTTSLPLPGSMWMPTWSLEKGTKEPSILTKEPTGGSTKKSHRASCNFSYLIAMSPVSSFFLVSK